MEKKVKKDKSKAGKNGRVRKSNLKNRDEDAQSDTPSAKARKASQTKAAEETQAVGQDFRVLEATERQFAVLCCSDPNLLKDPSYKSSLQAILDKYQLQRGAFEQAVLKRNDEYFQKLLIKTTEPMPSGDPAGQTCAGNGPQQQPVQQQPQQQQHLVQGS